MVSNKYFRSKEIMKTSLLIALILKLVFVSGIVSAKDIESLDDAFNSTVSAFDLLLCKIDSVLACKEHGEAKEGICATGVFLLPDKSTVLISVTFSEKNSYLLEFYNAATSGEKRKQLNILAEVVAEKIGVAPLPNTGGQVWLGKLQNMQFGISGIDSGKFIKDLAKHTTVQIFIRDSDNVFLVLRTPNGIKNIRILPRNLEKYEGILRQEQ